MNTAQDTPKTETKATITNDPPVRAANANEMGHIIGLEANAEYFVIRKPTTEYTRERSKALLHDAKVFIDSNREFAEHQIKELNEKYGEPAKARVHEFRGVVEKRFDEMAKEIETRFEKLEAELGERGLLPRKAGEATSANMPGETPGEMPSGGNGASTPSTPKKRTPKNG